MKRIVIFAALLLAATLAAAAPSVEKAASDAPLAWIDGLAEGLHAAQRDNRPLLVVAGSTDCPWCEKLAIEFRKPSLIDKLKKRRLALVHVDIEAEPTAVRTLAVGPIPALRLLSPRGRIVASHDGYLTADELTKWLDENLEHASTAPPCTADQHAAARCEGSRRVDRAIQAIRSAACAKRLCAGWRRIRSWRQAASRPRWKKEIWRPG